jgi:hypothetical protein
VSLSLNFEAYEYQFPATNVPIRYTSSLTSTIVLTVITHLLFVSIRNALKEFWGNYNQTYIFVNPVSADAVTFQTDIPTLEKIKRKVVIVLKTRQMKAEEFLDVNVSKDIMMMEANRSILENIFNVCQVSTPCLSLCGLMNTPFLIQINIITPY